MEFSKTQVGRMLEQVKQAMLARFPIVHISTRNIEIIQELLYGNNSIDSLVPRVCWKVDGIAKLAKEEIGLVDKETGAFKSIADNYKVGTMSVESIKVPTLFVNYVNEWNSVLSLARNFISLYYGVKKSESQLSPSLVDAASRSLMIIVTPKNESIPPSIEPYVKTVHIPPLSDQEIEETILDKLLGNMIPEDLIDNQLRNQMIVNFRGFSRNKINQMLSLMIAEQVIDLENLDRVGIMKIIRAEKKQLLDNCNGLKWENTNITGAAGLSNITQWMLNRKSIFDDPELAACQHMDIPNGVLISGIPGSGKSLMAKTAARILDMPLISLDMGALRGGIMGESEHNMIDALSTAEQMAPCVLWVDEIEKAFSGAGESSSSSDGGVGRRMFGKFLTWMQEKSAACFVFATSNDITSLPPELFRSERFDRKFFTFMPTASECAQIFAANIRSQNAAYDKEVGMMPQRMKIMRAKHLFDADLENPDFWIDILNKNCTHNFEGCRLKNRNEGLKDENENPKPPFYTWSDAVKPKNKLMTGADISALIKEAKICIQPAPLRHNVPDVIYEANAVRSAIISIMKSNNYKPYGETNLKDIVKCFLKLQENGFTPASGNCILDFDDYDEDRKYYEFDPAKHLWENEYDKVLYHTIVGAINHYTKQLSKI